MKIAFTIVLILLSSTAFAQDWWLPASGWTQIMVDEDMGWSFTARFNVEIGSTYWKVYLPWRDKEIIWAQAYLEDSSLTPYLIYGTGEYLFSHAWIMCWLETGSTYTEEYEVWVQVVVRTIEDQPKWIDLEATPECRGFYTRNDVHKKLGGLSRRR